MNRQSFFYILQNGVTSFIGSQFSNPRGVAGVISTYFMNLLNRKQYQIVQKIFCNQKPNYVLDIGFGNGYLLKILARRREASFFGIETSKDMLQQALKHNKKLVYKKNMHLGQGDVKNMKFKDEMFDFIYTINTVYFWENFEKSYVEIYRTLKKGGIFANVFYTKQWLDKIQYTKYHFLKYSQEELFYKVRKMKFSKIKLIELKKDCAYCLLVKK